MADPTPARPTTALAPRDAVARALADYFSPPTRQASIAKMIRDESQSVDSITTSAIAEVIRTESLWPCTPQSIFDCVLAATALGLRVGKDLGHAYILPFRDNKTNTTIATFLIGYRGLVTLARRSGEIVSITANIVHARDVFDASEGTDGHLVHKPAYFGKGGRGEPVGVYAFANLTGGGEQWTVMSVADVEAVRSRSRAGQSGPWVTDWSEMAKKTAVRRLAKMLPISVDAEQAIAQDDRRDFEDARDVTPLRAASPSLPSSDQSGAIPTATERLREEIRAQQAEPPHDAKTGEVLPSENAAPSPADVPAKRAPRKAAEKAAEPVSDMTAVNVTPGPAGKAAPKEPAPGDGFAEAAQIISAAEAADTRNELTALQDTLNGAIDAKRMGSMHVAKAAEAIKRGIERVDHG